MITLPLGTKEFLAVLIVDKLGNLTTLDAVTVTFDVYGEDDTKVVDSAIATTDVMTVQCLVDTSTWDEGNYRMFVNVDAPPQRPILGPFKFAVEDPSND